MHSVVIADTSCLILFSKIDLLTILRKLYPVIKITPEVADEFGEELPDWILIQPASKKNFKKLKSYTLGEGEISSIALALDLHDSLIILDDEKAKKVAKSLQLNVTGSLGIILRAKQEGLIPTVKDIIYKIKETNFHLHLNLEELVLKLANESG